MYVPAISIICCIYKMEATLRRAVDSVLNQNFKDFELLLIDDGSPDNCPAICDDYAQKDNRVKAFHKPNGGLSDARNYGIERAKGKYTIFVDPDDWIDPEGMDKLYKTAERENADMTICDFYREDKYIRYYEKQKPSSLEHTIVLKELFSKIHGSTCNKLIKRELYQKYNVQNPKGVYGCEDQYVMASFLKHNIKVAYCPIAYYHYITNTNSLTHKYDLSTLQMDKHIINMFSELLKDTEVYQIAHDKKKWYTLCRAFHYGGNLFSSKEFKKEFKSYEYLLHIMKNKNNMIDRCLIYCSLKGLYKVSNKIFWLLVDIKQIIKKIKA